jgi:hypothetical protein
MKKTYLITAQCQNARCSTGTFTTTRSKITKISTGGTPYQIAKVVCPGCKMWADITGIEEA